MRIAFTAAILPQITFSSPRFNVRNLLSRFHEFDQELHELEDRGLIIEDEDFNTQWRAGSLVTLWWMANQVREIAAEKITYEEWLQRQLIEGVITREQKNRWNEAIHAAGDVLSGGVKAFIEATSKGFAEAVTNRLP
jgi:hypothetical protein